MGATICKRCRAIVPNTWPENNPLDFIARLAALMPRPRVNLTRFHGVFAPNSHYRAEVTPAKRGKGNKVKVSDEPQTPVERRAAMTWAQRLKRVFNIDIQACQSCGGVMKVIARMPGAPIWPASRPVRLTNQKQPTVQLKSLCRVARRGFGLPEGQNGADCGIKAGGFFAIGVDTGRVLSD